jgi:hypothetical protein
MPDHQNLHGLRIRDKHITPTLQVWTKPAAYMIQSGAHAETWTFVYTDCSAWELSPKFKASALVALAAMGACCI